MRGFFFSPKKANVRIFSMTYHFAFHYKIPTDYLKNNLRILTHDLTRTFKTRGLQLTNSAGSRGIQFLFESRNPAGLVMRDLRDQNGTKMPVFDRNILFFYQEI